MVTIAMLLAGLAMLFAVLSAAGKVPLWVAVFLLALLALLQVGGVR